MKQVDTYFLLPGALQVSKDPLLVTTILGSCISVCLWDRRRNIGGINHYMLPLWNGQGLASPKYGNIAIEKLIAQMVRMGSLKKDMVAKIFGGGEVLQSNCCVFNIGKRNTDYAKEVFSNIEIPVVGQSTGGEYGRKIIFNTSTGEIRMKYVRKTKLNKQ
ncbi:MAG: chemotaxis protein CheD [Bacteroidota bacterium]|nr:chemotaxis protein CheD [Bacteroidota bacterium]